MRVLDEIKQYLLKMYQINARYKQPDSSKDDYQEQNIVVIYPNNIKYTINEASGTIGIEVSGSLALYVTEGREKEGFLFEKMLLNQKDAKFKCTSDMSVNHWNPEVLEISCGFEYHTQQEFNKETRMVLDYSWDVIINK